MATVTQNYMIKEGHAKGAELFDIIGMIHYVIDIALLSYHGQ